jgi:hypothetical protein
LAAVFCSESRFCRIPALRVISDDMVAYPSGYRPYWRALAVRAVLAVRLPIDTIGCQRIASSGLKTCKSA